MATLDDLLPILAVRQTHNLSGPPVIFTHVTHDSRQVKPGTLFVAVAGGRADGHGYIPAALAAGAVAVLGTQTYGELPGADELTDAGVPYLQVDKSRHALAVASALLHAFPSRSLSVIGVTGTDGKTTTCTVLEAILAAAGGVERVGVITTMGARIGGVEQDTGFHVTTPDAPDVQRYLAEMVGAGCTHAVVESTSHGLAQARVDAVDFDVAAVTNITHEHLDYHGSRDAYVAAKGLLYRALFRSAPKPGVPRVAVLNGDDAGSVGALQAILAQERAGSQLEVVTRIYGLDQHAGFDVCGTEIDYAPDRTRFTVRWWGGAFPLDSHLIGEFNVYNILCATTVALALGVAPGAIQRGVAALQGVIGRMERIDRGQDFLALVDFAHSPASLERALLTLRVVVQQSGGRGRIIAVFGSAGLRDREKRRLMGQVSGRLADFTVITAEDPRTEDLAEINRAIAAGVLEHTPADRCVIVPDRAAAIQYALDMAWPGDVVAAFGKGHERSMCFGETEYPWSDQEVVGEALEQRRLRGLKIED